VGITKKNATGIKRNFTSRIGLVAAVAVAVAVAVVAAV
jgi:hypothetical protein